MRRIISKQQESQKRKRKQLIAGGVLIILMVFSILGYSFSGRVIEDSQNEGLNYNGRNFVQQNGFWILNLQGINKDFVFAYNPKQVEEIPVNGSIKNLNNYLQKPLYISSPDIMAEAEIRNNIFGVERIQSACFEEDCKDKNLPTKTCRDNFIIIKESDKTEILQKDNCVFIQGKKEELVKLTDRFLFAVLEID